MQAASIFISLAAATGLATAAPSLYPGADPGSAQVTVSETGASLSNNAFTAIYETDGSSVTFGGLKTAEGTTLIEGGTPLFTIYLKDGRVLNSTNMKSSGLSRSCTESPGCDTHEILCGSFESPDGSLSVHWQGILADGSHYLRHKLIFSAGDQPLHIKKIVALDYDAADGTGTPTISGNTSHGCVVVNDKMFFGLETPMSVMTAGGKSTHQDSPWSANSWKAESFGPAFNLPLSFRKPYGSRYAATDGPVLTHLKQAEGPVYFAKGGSCSITFQYKSGNHKLNMVGVQLLDTKGLVVSEDVHEGETGNTSTNNTYIINVPTAGEYRLRYWAQTRSEPIDSSGSISLSLPQDADANPEHATKPNKVEGVWLRDAALAAGQPWQVTGVVGLFEPSQERRSFLAYIERERAVPYRPFVHYNDWYEIGIRVHDYQDPKLRTSESMWLKLLDIWNEELYTKRGTQLDGFILDDGWDDFNSLWDFHCGFPNGFAKLAEKAALQGARLGTWLGPVGGYGTSKMLRISYWNREHPDNQIENFQLSNKKYFDAFVGRCNQMIMNHGVRYFKFDGISTKFHAKGPANIEDAEGILSVIGALRKTKSDVFINTSVGTWASPFWFMHTDSIWRQENDFDQMGTAGDERDRWITYRDRLVHEVFVEGAPLCPINSLMTHGTIISKNGPPHIMSRAPENCRKEMRMAFGCGSSLQEVYADTDLLSQQGGILWDELAANIAWVRRNADVLPDVHWVGGNPWDGKDGSIYGYAAWNQQKATLTLRNSSAKGKTLRTTLREVLDVPPGVKGRVTFRNSFADQRLLPGLTDVAVDVDAPITITMKPLEVIVMEGECAM